MSSKPFRICFEVCFPACSNLGDKARTLHRSLDRLVSGQWLERIPRSPCASCISGNLLWRTSLMGRECSHSPHLWCHTHMSCTALHPAHIWGSRGTCQWFGCSIRSHRSWSIQRWQSTPRKPPEKGTRESIYIHPGEPCSLDILPHRRGRHHRSPEVRSSRRHKARGERSDGLSQVPRLGHSQHACPLLTELGMYVLNRIPGVSGPPKPSAVTGRCLRRLGRLPKNNSLAACSLLEKFCELQGTGQGFGLRKLAYPT